MEDSSIRDDTYLVDGFSVLSETEQHNVSLSELYKGQFDEVYKILRGLGTFNDTMINQIMGQYYNTLGLNDYYFRTSTPQMIAHNIIPVITAKILHEHSGLDFFPVIEQVNEDKVFIMVKTSLLNRRSSQNYTVERDIEKKYLNLEGKSKPMWRMQCFRSKNSIFDDPENFFERLRTYFLQKPVFRVEELDPLELDLSLLLDKDFYMNKKGTITERIFHKLNKKLVESETGLGLAISLEPRRSNVYRLDIAFRREYMHNDFYSRVGDCIMIYGFYSKSKYFEPLSNGVCILTAFITTLPKNQLVNSGDSLDSRVKELVEAIKLYTIPPRSNYLDLTLDRSLTIHEAVYAYCASCFIEHFSGSVGPHVATVEKFAKREQISPSELYDIRSKLMVQPYLSHQVFSAVSENLSLVKRLYKEFCSLHDPEQNRGKLNPWVEDTKLKEEIKQCEDKEHSDILTFFLKINRYTLRTNFFVPNKLCFCFRLDPTFLSTVDYPQKPYAILQILGPHFRGFHIRFSEISRGGIRVIQSFSREAYTRNKLQVFDEAYNLSYTQSLKNKDIPEGGAKGAILLEMTPKKEIAESFTIFSFMCYVDGTLDVMLPNEHVVDCLRRDEIYFLGPDEHTGTGKLMDWAAKYAKSRGYPYWRAFTTGKEPEMGGIPHDMFGVTTASIETFIQELFKKYGMEEHKVTRFLTGGPDGDLGSNALMASNTKTLTVVDRSGVLHDPEGLDIGELRRLASLRLKGERTCSMMYNPALLSPKGFMVPEEAVNVKLPDGSTVKRGFKFRDEFHLGGAGADLFNPCGGRPSSITPFNVDRLFNDHGKCVFGFIVEGANVFISQDARRILESKGVVLFKDASTNKGGVTSSSYEVLAALVLDDKTFESQFSVKPGGECTNFRQEYIAEIISIIKTNARREFHALWNEGLRTGKPRCDLTDILSSKIIDLKRSIMESNIMLEDVCLFNNVLSMAVPKPLLKLVPLDVIRQRLPERYLQAFVAAYIASNFYYGQQFSDDTSVFAFYDYVNQLKSQKPLVTVE